MLNIAAKENIEKLLTLPLEEQRVELLINSKNSGNYSYTEYGVYETDEKLCFFVDTRSLVCFTTKPFIKSNRTYGLTYNKITKKSLLWFQRKTEWTHLKHFFKYLQLDWLLNFSQDCSNSHELFQRILTNNAIGKIISGKITNPDELIKSFISYSLKRKISETNRKKLLRGLKSNNFPSINILVYWNRAAADFNQMLNTIIEKRAGQPNSRQMLNSSWEQIVHDMVPQAIALNKKINFSWSDKRMINEHTNWTRKIMKYQTKTKSSEDLYCNLKFPINKLKLLRNEQDVFIEGTVQIHCVYTSYFQRIKNKTYFALHDSMCNGTIGICQHNWKTDNTHNDWVVDQIYSKRDSTVAPEHHIRINEIIARKDVQEFFNICARKCNVNEMEAMEFVNLI